MDANSTQVFLVFETFDLVAVQALASIYADTRLFGRPSPHFLGLLGRLLGALDLVSSTNSPGISLAFDGEELTSLLAVYDNPVSDEPVPDEPPKVTADMDRILASRAKMKAAIEALLISPSTYWPFPTKPGQA